jgi:hypothetical protein
MSTLLKESPQTAEGSRESRWLMAVFLAVYVISLFSGPSLASWLGAPRSAVGGEPPWYFIREDFFTGLGLLLGVLVVVAFGAAVWRRKRSSISPLLWMILIWMLPGAILGLWIYLRCDHFFDYSHATCPWPTFEAYMAIKNQLVFGVLGAAFLLFAVLSLWKRRRPSLP